MSMINIYIIKNEEEDGRSGRACQPTTPLVVNIPRGSPTDVGYPPLTRKQHTLTLMK